MKTLTFDYQKKLEPIRGVFLFFLILLIANIFWKYDVLGEESTDVTSKVTFWGCNISAPFVWMSYHVAHVTASVLQFFGSRVSIVPTNILRYSNGNSVQVIWACTGIKQAYICFCILAFSRGPWSKKLWYIPLCLLVVYLFNIFRIACIVGCIHFHPNWFEPLHLYAFKYVFYGVIFLMWAFWEEKFALKEWSKKEKLAKTSKRT